MLECEGEFRRVPKWLWLHQRKGIKEQTTAETADVRAGLISDIAGLIMKESKQRHLLTGVQSSSERHVQYYK